MKQGYVGIENRTTPLVLIIDGRPTVRHPLLLSVSEGGTRRISARDPKDSTTGRVLISDLDEGVVQGSLVVNVVHEAAEFFLWVHLWLLIFM